MVITDFLERNARLYGSDIALVEVNPSEERDSAVTWREASLIAEAQPDAPYRRELSWQDFDRRANRFANFLLSRNVRRGTKVGILLMNCLEWLPIYFGILKAGCIAVPLNFRMRPMKFPTALIWQMWRCWSSGRNLFHGSTRFRQA
jgi:long-chain acyl-CoA synthetase